MNKIKPLKLYFSLLRLSYIISAVLAFSLMSDGFHWMLLSALISGLVMIALQFAGSIIAEKMIQEQNYMGLLLAFVLNSMILPSYFILLGLFGYYVLLNQKMINSFPEEKNPAWLNACFDWIKNMTKTTEKVS